MKCHRPNKQKYLKCSLAGETKQNFNVCYQVEIFLFSKKLFSTEALKSISAFFFVFIL